MADIIVMHPDFVHFNEKLPGAYVSGMAVDVFEDGRIGPGNEQHPRFIVIRIPGVPVEDVLDVIEEMEDQSREMIKRRRQKLVWTRLPRKIMRRIRRDREIKLTMSQLRAFLTRLD